MLPFLKYAASYADFTQEPEMNIALSCAKKQKNFMTSN